MKIRKFPETNTVHFRYKESDSLLKTVTAFANFQDGTILLELEDQADFSEFLKPWQMAELLSNQINNSISPVPDYSILSSPDRQSLILRIRKGDETPYLYRGKAYERRNSSTVETSMQTFQDLILSGKSISDDSLEASTQNLSFQILAMKASREIGIRKLDSDVLKAFGLNCRGRFNKAAELLSDTNRFPGIEFTVYDNSGGTFRFLRSIEHVSVLCQYEKALSVYRRFSQEKVNEGSLEPVPESAFMQALAIALTHRSWSVPEPTQVQIFSDKTVVVFPGSFPSGISGTALSTSLSSCRNPILAYVFLRLNLIEQSETCLRPILDAYIDSDSKPEFTSNQSMTIISLPVLCKSAVMITSAQRQLLSQMNPHIHYSRKDLENLTGFRRGRLMRLVDKLIQSGTVKIINSGRSTRYSRISRI